MASPRIHAGVVDICYAVPCRHSDWQETAICPDDPLSVREEALDISGIGDAPYEWSWETYKEFLS